MNMKIALIQMDVTYGDPKVNFARVGKWVMDAVQTGAEMVILPELWDTGYDIERLDVLADKDAKATTEFLSDLAKQYNIGLIGGSVAEQSKDGIKNTMLVLNQNGELVHKYSKLHLSQLMGEHLHLVEGHAAARSEVDGVLLAGFLCHDLCFPDWLRKSAVHRANVMSVVSVCSK